MTVQNMNKQLKYGDIVRLKTRLLFSGWKGFGVVVEYCRHSDIVRFLRLRPGYSDDALIIPGMCVRREVSKTREPSKELLELASKVLSENK